MKKKFLTIALAAAMLVSSVATFGAAAEDAGSQTILNQAFIDPSDNSPTTFTGMSTPQDQKITFQSSGDVVYKDDVKLEVNWVVNDLVIDYDTEKVWDNNNLTWLDGNKVNPDEKAGVENNGVVEFRIKNYSAQDFNVNVGFCKSANIGGVDVSFSNPESSEIPENYVEYFRGEMAHQSSSLEQIGNDDQISFGIGDNNNILLESVIDCSQENKGQYKGFYYEYPGHDKVPNLKIRLKPTVEIYDNNLLNNEEVNLGTYTLTLIKTTDADNIID